MNSFPHRLHSILSGAWRRRYVLVIPTLLLPTLGFFIGVSSPKLYKAHTSMLIQETAKMNPFLEDLAVSAMLKERMEALKTLLHSRHILNKVATELELVDENSSDGERDWVIGQMAGSLNIQMVGKDLIRINHTSANADGMKEFLAAVSRHFVEQLLAPERSSIRDSSRFLGQHLEKRREELDIAETALADFKAAHAQALPELHSMNISRLSQLKQKLAEREAELAGAVKNVGGLNQLLSRTNPVVGRIEEQIVKIRGELALLGARYTDKHSKVQALKRTLRRLEAERENAIKNTEKIVDTDQLWDIASASSQNSDTDQQPILISQLKNLQVAKSKADSLNEEISSLQEMIATIESGLNDFGKKESELIRLQRGLSVKQTLYEDLLKRFEMAEVTGSLGQFEEGKRIKIIDRPFTPSRPSNLPPILFAIAGIFGGIFLGAGFAVILEMTDTSLRKKETLESIAGAPVISRMPAL